MRDYTGGYARTTVHQNLAAALGARRERLRRLAARSTELGLGDAGAHEITDVVSCPGTDSCKLGITSSMGLNAAVQERLEQMEIDDPLTRSIHIKMSGCPNGCSQHHIANIGFYGASMKVGEPQIPAYVAHLGGNYEGGEVVYGHAPQGRACPPSACRTRSSAGCATTRPSAQRRRGVQRLRRARRHRRASRTLVKDLAMPVEFGLENMSHFIDWDRKEPFQVVRGEGECAV